MAKPKNQRKKNAFFNKNVFGLNQKYLLKTKSFSGVSFVEKHEGNKLRHTKNLIKNFKFLFCFSRFARALNSQTEFTIFPRVWIAWRKI